MHLKRSSKFEKSANNEKKSSETASKSLLEFFNTLENVLKYLNFYYTWSIDGFAQQKVREEQTVVLLVQVVVSALEKGIA